MSNSQYAPAPSLDGQLKLVEHVSEIRATRPQAIAEALEHRRRRPLLNENGVMFLVAADHTARGVLKSGTDRMAMANRGELLRPQVRGLVVGRTLLYPPDGDVAAAVDAAAGVLLKRRVAA
jgi:hypothetical protein